MFIITVYGWEERTATRIQIGCEEPAKLTSAYINALGYHNTVVEGDEPNRSDAEVERAKRLMERVGPALYNLN